MNLAAVYSVLGNKGDAMAWLQKGYRDVRLDYSLLGWIPDSIR
jgi:hypothetical protein